MAKHSILVVEDEQTVRRLLEYRLAKEEYRVRTAANGEEALELIGQELPDLVVSDIMMPVMDGFALQAAMQERRETRAIPFIFLTAKADEQSRLKGRRMGVDDYITKPFDIEQLLSRVERLLDRTRQFSTQLDARIGQDFSKRLMPKRMPEVDGYRARFHNAPREQGGGDLFDWNSPEEGIYFITIGDVMGKGLQAKVYAFSFLGYLRTMLKSLMRTSRSPADLLRQVNLMLLDDPPMEETFASLLLFRWEPAKHLVTFANAGHCRPVLATRGGAEILAHSDLILGLDRSAEYTDSSIEMPPGSALLAYTDGLLEQEMAAGHQLGEAGLKASVGRVFGEPDPVQSLLDDVLALSSHREFKDDIMVFWLERLQIRERVTPRWFSPFADAR
jgi:serine phosphatase RsbU (regulator of sigma subunit)